MRSIYSALARKNGGRRWPCGLKHRFFLIFGSFVSRQRNNKKELTDVRGKTQQLNKPNHPIAPLLP
jgi:hypothetical protein